MRRVRLIPRLLAINRWNHHSHLNRDLAIIFEVLRARMQHPGT